MVVVNQHTALRVLIDVDKSKKKSKRGSNIAQGPSSIYFYVGLLYNFGFWKDSTFVQMD